MTEESRGISDEEHDDNMNFITDALMRVPKATGISLLKEGIEHNSGGSMDRARWRQLANVARHDPKTFENVVLDARRAGMRVRQTRAEARNKERKERLAERAQRRASGQG